MNSINPGELEYHETLDMPGYIFAAYMNPADVILSAATKYAEDNHLDTPRLLRVTVREYIFVMDCIRFMCTWAVPMSDSYFASQPAALAVFDRKWWESLSVFPDGGAKLFTAPCPTCGDECDWIGSEYAGRSSNRPDCKRCHTEPRVAPTRA